MKNDLYFLHKHKRMSLKSFNLVMGLLADSANISTSTVKPHDQTINKIHVETRDGIRLNIFYDVDDATISATYVIEQLLHLKRQDINERIKRWCRTKDGLWAVDMLVNHKKDTWNEELVYKYRGNQLWKYEVRDFDWNRVYRKEFTDKILRDGVYNAETDEFNFSAIKNTGTMQQFYIEGKWDDFPGNHWCKVKFLYQYLLPLFGINVDNSMMNLMNWLDAMVRKKYFMKSINSQEKDELQFFIKDDGTIDYRTISKSNDEIKDMTNNTKSVSMTDKTNDVNPTDDCEEVYKVWSEYLDSRTAIDTNDIDSW